MDSRVYERLAAARKDGESFSKAIHRLLSEIEEAHTGSDILRGLGSIVPLSNDDAEVFRNVVAEDRASETWDDGDVR